MNQIHLIASSSFPEKFLGSLAVTTPSSSSLVILLIFSYSGYSLTRRSDSILPISSRLGVCQRFHSPSGELILESCSKAISLLGTGVWIGRGFSEGKVWVVGSVIGVRGQSDGLS